MKVGFTGTRTGLTTHQIDKLREFFKISAIDEFHHGDCVGADEIAHSIADILTIPIITHPPDNDIHRAFCKGAEQERKPLPYLDRNKAIVDETDYLLVLPKGMKEEIRSGTWSTKRYAESMYKKTVIIWPDGTVEY